MDIALIGACGLYCGGCENYNKNCDGCNSKRLTEHCLQCSIRLCNREKGYISCVQCANYPCPTFEEFYAGGKKWEKAKHRSDIKKNLKYLLEGGNDNWLQYQSDRWKCECGAGYKYYDSVCGGCGNKLNSYINVESKTIVIMGREEVLQNKKISLTQLQENDGEILGKYFEELSLETKKRFGPHPLTHKYAEYLCSNLENDFYTIRLVIKDIEENAIIGYFILDFNLSPHEIERYSRVKTNKYPHGIKLTPYKNVLFAPSIADKYQNKGVASMVMPHIIEAMKTSGIKSMVLMGGTQETNLRAVRFYEKFGFEQVGGYKTEIFNHDMIRYL